MADVDPAFLQGNGVGRAYGCTVETPGAFFCVPKYLGLGKLAFGVGTPAATEGAAFEKYYGTDSGPVVNTEFLYIKQDTCLAAVCFFHVGTSLSIYGCVCVFFGKLMFPYLPFGATPAGHMANGPIWATAIQWPFGASPAGRMANVPIQDPCSPGFL